MQMILRPQGGTNVFTAINLFKIGATAPAVTSSPLRAPILKRLIAFIPPPPQQKTKSEPMILRPQGDQNRRDGPSGYIKPPTGADSEKVDCVYPLPPHLSKNKSEQMILWPQGNTNVFTAINLFKIGATAPAVTSSPLWAPIFEKVDCLYPHPSKNKK